MASRLTACEQFYDAYRARTKFARTHLEKTRDVFQRTFTRLKRKLKQFELVCVIHSHFKGLKATGGSKWHSHAIGIAAAQWAAGRSRCRSSLVTGAEAKAKKPRQV